MKRVLISVSNRDGLGEFASGLADLGCKIVGTTGTQSYLQKKGIDSESVEDVTGFQKILEGRVKTLHPRIFGGILARKNHSVDKKELKKIGAEYIDIVVVNLYPFQKVIENKKHLSQDAIENIDIGGVSLLRAAAKNYKDVLVVSHPDDYSDTLELLKAEKENPKKAAKRLAQFRLQQAGKAFDLVSSYDTLIARYMIGLGTKTSAAGAAGEAGEKELFPQTLQTSYTKLNDLRYGENPHQKAAIYASTSSSERAGSLLDAKQLHGKQLSFNNMRDAQAALDIARQFARPVSAHVKHANPCAVALGENVLQAVKKAYNADPVSIFGGIVACNKEIDSTLARFLSKIFLEIIIAPRFSADALGILCKKKNVRLLQLPFRTKKQVYMDHVSLPHALLVQEHDSMALRPSQLQVVTRKKPTPTQIQELLFAWNVVKLVKSNAIVVSHGECTKGIGAGQMSRIQAVEIALKQAKKKGTVLASDAFFPMGDSVKMASKHGIRAIIQPGGSVRDSDSIELCDRNNMSMVFTGIRHFLH